MSAEVTRVARHRAVPSLAVRVRLPRMLALLGLLATSLLVLSAPSHPSVQPVAGSASSPVRVMLAGDSITEQFTGDYTWRWRLWQEFRRQHVPVDFVGPFTGLDGLLYTHHYLAPAAWTDRAHAGIVGTWVEDQKLSIARWVTRYRPDVLMVELGTNDLHAGESAAQVTAWMREYLSAAHDARPTMRIAVADVLSAVTYPTGTSYFPAGSSNLDLNRRVRAFLAQMRAAGWPIVSIDTSTAAWHPRTMSVDGVHPTPRGEIYLAQKYADALHRRLGVLPQVPRIARVDTVWQPEAAARVAVRGHRATFTWPVATWGSHVIRGVLRIQHPGWARPHTYRTTVDYQDLLRVTLPPGRYRYTLTPERKWMVGAPGPSRSFTVR